MQTKYRDVGDDDYACGRIKYVNYCISGMAGDNDDRL